MLTSACWNLSKIDLLQIHLVNHLKLRGNLLIFLRWLSKEDTQLLKKDYRDILESIWDPSDLSHSEIEFFNAFLSHAKFKHTHSKFEQY